MLKSILLSTSDTYRSIEPGAWDYVMRAYRSILRRLLLSFVVCLLLCGILCAEIPELLSLTDIASNDFTVLKAGSRECIQTLSAAIYESVPLKPNNFECAACTYCAPSLIDTETISPDLFVLYSELRR